MLWIQGRLCPERAIKDIHQIYFSKAVVRWMSRFVLRYRALSTFLTVGIPRGTPTVKSREPIALVIELNGCPRFLRFLPLGKLATTILDSRRSVVDRLHHTSKEPASRRISLPAASPLDCHRESRQERLPFFRCGSSGELDRRSDHKTIGRS